MYSRYFNFHTITDSIGFCSLFRLLLLLLSYYVHTGSSCTYARFKYFSSGMTSRPSCSWCPLTQTCFAPSKDRTDSSLVPDECLDPKTNTSVDVRYEYNCPLGPQSYPNHPPALLPNWMGTFYEAGILDQVRLVDLSLPGSHDSLSYDLSLTVSEDGIDSLKRIAHLLHTLSGGMLHLLPGDLEEFFRMQGKTQQLTLSQQLDNGIRFIDIRIMLEHDKHEWYSIHFMQSVHPAEDYMRQIRRWLDDHPHEIIVVWLSKHGSTTATGQSAYPGVTTAEKQQFWKKFIAIFDGLLLHTTESSIFNTSMAQLIERNHRVIAFVSDYEEFTQHSPHALDAAVIQNVYDDGEGVFRTEQLIQTHVDYFKNATENNKHINYHGGYTLLGMNTASPGWQILSAAKRQFLHWMKDLNSMPPQELTTTTLSDWSIDGHYTPFMQDEQNMATPSIFWRLVLAVRWQVANLMGTAMDDTEWQVDELQTSIFDSCASHIKIPGVKKWCPLNLLDIAQLAAYYNQVALEEAYIKSYMDGESDPFREYSAFPNAFYLDAYDYDGTTRIGPDLLDGTKRSKTTNSTTKDARYAIVDTILAYNARIACQHSIVSAVKCEHLLEMINKRRLKYPLQRWDEFNLARRNDWPSFSYDSPIQPEHPGLAKESIIW